MRIRRALLAITLGFATTWATCSAVPAAAQLQTDADPLHSATLALEHGELHLQLRHVHAEAPRRAAGSTAFQEADQEFHLADSQLGEITQRHAPNESFMCRPSETIVPSRRSWMLVTALQFGLDPDPPSGTSPPILRI